MFENVGKKIKTLATVVCVLGIIISILSGISDVFFGGFFAGTEDVIVGILRMAGGSFASWIGSFFIYGLGELIENSAKIAKACDMMGRSHIWALPVKENNPPTPEYSETWTCKECGEINQRSARICKSCGKDK